MRFLQRLFPSRQQEDARRLAVEPVGEIDVVAELSTSFGEDELQAIDRIVGGTV